MPVAKPVRRWGRREIIALRKALHMSIAEFAEALGVGDRTVKKWESARPQPPGPSSEEALETLLLKRSDDSVRDWFRAELEMPRDNRAATPHAATRDELLSRLKKLLSSQFEEVLYRAQVPREHLPAATAAPAVRAVELMRYAEQQNQLERLARIVQQVLTEGRPASADPR